MERVQKYVSLPSFCLGYDILFYSFNMKKFTKIFFSTLLLFFVAGVIPALASAAWVGNSAVYVKNTWYYAGTPFEWCTGGAFHGADLGSFYGSLPLSGQSHVRDYDNVQWAEGATMKMCFKFDDNENYTTINLTMDPNGWKYPDMEFKYGGANFMSLAVDISELSVGQHTIYVWFNSDEEYDSNGGANYVATFTKVFEGGGHEDSPIILNTTDDLDLLATLVNNGTFRSTEMYFELGADLDYTGKTFTPIGTEGNPFNGHFNGKGKTLSGITLTGESNVGIFGYINQGTVENLIVDDDCSITGDEYVGGIVGYNYWGSILGCTNRAAINGNLYVGGIAGHSEGYISDCANIGNIHGDESSGYLGGIVGENSGTVEGCVCNSNISGGNYVGGVLGIIDLSGAYMEACIYSGTSVTAEESSAGALVGLVMSSEGDAPRRHNAVARDREYVPIHNNYYVNDFGLGGAHGEDVVENDGAVRGYILGTSLVSSDVIGQETELSFPNNGIVFYENGLKFGEDSFILSFLPLYNVGGNDEVLSQYDGNTASVKLINRTLFTDGDWNTLCLPFEVEDGNEEDDISFTGTLLEGATVMTLASSDFSDGTLSMEFDLAESISAGVPYIVKWEENNDELPDIVNPKFNNVYIMDVPDLGNTKVETKCVDFIGCFEPVSFEANPNILYLGSNSTLYYPNTSMTFYAFRAYFTLNLEGGSSAIKAFNLSFGDEEMGIKEICNSSSSSDAWYTLEGRRLNERPATSGIYIHNGRKVVF